MSGNLFNDSGPIDVTLEVTITQGQSGLRSNGIGGILHNPQISITGTPPSDVV